MQTFLSNGRDAVAKPSARSPASLFLIAQALLWPVVALATAEARRGITGYVPHIYVTIPIWGWGALILIVVSALMVLVVSEKFMPRLAALTSLAATSTYMMLLHVFLGFYFLERHDMMTYVGMVVDILNTGTIPEYNYYPFVSALVAGLSISTGLSTREWFLVLPTLFLLIFWTGFLLWIQAISPSARHMTTAAFLVALPLYFSTFHNLLYHMTVGVMLLPLGMFWLWRATSVETTVGIVLVSVATALVHPLTAVLWVVVAASLLPRHFRNGANRGPFTALVIGGTVLTVWLVNQRLVVTDLARAIRTILEFSPDTTSGAAGSLLSNIPLPAVVSLAIFSGADDALLGGLAVLGAATAFRYRASHALRDLLMPAAVVAAILAGVFMFTRVHNPIRLLNLNPALVLILPFATWTTWKWLNGRITQKLTVVAVVALMIFVSWFGLFASPLIYRPTDHVTADLVHGANWFVEHHGSASEYDYGIGATYELQTRAVRAGDFVQGPLQVRDRDGLAFFTGSMLEYNYSAARSPLQYTYLSAYDVYAYGELWKDSVVVKESKLNLSNLRSAYSVIYAGGEFEVILLADAEPVPDRT